MDRFKMEIGDLLTDGIDISDVKECHSRYHEWNGFTLQRGFWYGFESRTGLPVVVPYYGYDTEDDDLKIFVRRPDGKWVEFRRLKISSIRPDASHIRWRGGKLSFYKWLRDVRFGSTNWWDSFIITPSRLEGLIKEYRKYVRYGRLPKFIWQTFEGGASK